MLASTTSGAVVEAQTLQMPGVRFGAPGRELIEKMKEMKEQRRRQRAGGGAAGSEVAEQAVDIAASLLAGPPAEVSRSEGSQHHLALGRVRDLIQTSRGDACMGAHHCPLEHHRLIDIEDLPAGVRQETFNVGLPFCHL